MIKNIFLLFSFLLNMIVLVLSANYLSNNKININITDPYKYRFNNKYKGGLHTGYPYTGFNCITSKSNEKYVYMITSQSLYNNNNNWRKCYRQSRYVSVYKRNLETSKMEDELKIGQEMTGNDIKYDCYYLQTKDYIKYYDPNYGSSYTKRYENICLEHGYVLRTDLISSERCSCTCCKPPGRYLVGGKGSDYVTTCGIDEEANILYYVGGNFHNCPSNFYTESSLVRVNLTNLNFIDRTLLKNIGNYSDFASWDESSLNTEYKYYNYPSTSEINNGIVYLSFATENTGFWLIDIRDYNLKLKYAFQKKMYEYFTYLDENQTSITDVEEYNLPTITKSFKDEKNTKIYFISETQWDNANIVIINYNNEVNTSSTIVKELNGISGIKDIKIDNLKNNIYLLVGQLKSDIYKLDMDFNVIPVSEECGIDTLSFPSEWKGAQSMEIDDNAGFIYVFFSNSYDFAGFATVKIKGLILNTSFYNFEERSSYYNQNMRKLKYLNVTNLNKYTGKIVVATVAERHNYYTRIVEMSLLGCAEGRAVNNDTCDICVSGSYTNKVGSIGCKLCDYGHSTDSSESEKCKLCDKGRYANLLGSTSCFECLPGYYSELNGVKFCNECEEGKYNSNTGSITATDCVECQLGKYSLLGSKDCDTCTLGKYTKNKKICINCPKGKYNNILGIVGVGNCKNCVKGRYSNISGSNSDINCKICEPGKYSLTFGSTSKITCIDCEAGKFRSQSMSAGEECAVCENGKYSYHAATTCLSCDKGKYNNGIDAIDHISCISCKSGKYNEILGANNENKCISCPSGKYSDVIGLNSSLGCIPCIKGKYNEKFGSSNIIDCKSCPQGKYRKYNGGNNLQDCLDCVVGKYSKEGAYKCIHCEIGKFGSSSGLSSCKKCQVGRYTDVNNTISCKICPTNSIQNKKSSYCECKEGTYMTSNKPLVCKSCPNHFICPKGSIIETLILQKKYWRANKTTLIVQECRKGYNCIGGKIHNNSDELCNEGHMGPICDVCKKGWAKNEGKCFKCLTDDKVKARSYFLTIVFPILISAVTLFMIKTANPDTTKSQKEPLSGVIKIFMNYAQIFSLASSFDINWPDMIIVLFDRTKEFSSPKISFYSSDCTIGWNYYDKLLVYLLLPLVYILIVSFILITYTKYIYEKKRNHFLFTEKWKKKYKTKEQYINKHPEPRIFYNAWACTSILIGLFLAWPTLIKQSLSIIPCKKYGNKYYLLEDLSIECYTPQHNGYSIVCYVSLIIYGIAVPMIAYNLINQKKYSLYDQKNKYQMPAPLSFLFLGYREEVWYYEFIVMAKKYSIILLSVFLKEYSRYQMICASLFIQTAFFVHVFLRPYDSITNYGILCNKLESMSLLALVVTFNSGLFFGTIKDQYNLGAFEFVLIFLLFLINALVIIYFFYYLAKLSVNKSIKLIKQYLLKIINNVPIFKKILSKNIIDKIYKWNEKEIINTYGIDLKSKYEIELFDNYFDKKKNFTNKIKSLLDESDLHLFSDFLNKIRSKIEIIERHRYWLAILKNRLYDKLRIELSKHLIDNNQNNNDNENENENNNDDDNKDHISISEINKLTLNKIVHEYIYSGINHTKFVNKKSKNALHDIRRQSLFRININQNDTIYSSESEITDDDIFDEDLQNNKNIEMIKNPIHTISKDNDNDDDDEKVIEVVL